VTSPAIRSDTPTKAKEITLSVSVATTLALNFGAALLVQDEKRIDKAWEPANETGQALTPASAAKLKLTQEELEAKFKATLTRATCK
jgi:hypothetical protein